MANAAQPFRSNRTRCLPRFGKIRWRQQKNDDRTSRVDLLRHGGRRPGHFRLLPGSQKPDLDAREESDRDGFQRAQVVVDRAGILPETMLGSYQVLPGNLFKYLIFAQI